MLRDVRMLHAHHASILYHPYKKCVTGSRVTHALAKQLQWVQAHVSTPQ